MIFIFEKQKQTKKTCYYQSGGIKMEQYGSKIVTISLEIMSVFPTTFSGLTILPTNKFGEPAFSSHLKNVCSSHLKMFVSICNFFFYSTVMFIISVSL